MNRAITLDAGWLFALVPFALAGITWLWGVLFEAVATMHAWWMRRTAEDSSAVATPAPFQPYEIVCKVQNSGAIPCAVCQMTVPDVFVLARDNWTFNGYTCEACAAAMTRAA